MELAPRNLSVPAPRDFPFRWSALALALAAAGILQTACGSGNGTTTGPNPTIALTVTPTSGSAPQGGSTSTVAGLTRKGGFHGNVTFTVEGVPAGVTATVGTPTTANDITSATVTIQVAATTVPGTYNLLLRGQGSGVTDATAAFALTVTAVVVPDYSLSLSQAALSILQGGNAPITVTITRTNFPDAVTLSLGNAPAGVTGVFNPPAPTGTASTLTVTVGSGVAPGVYNLTVNGTGAAGNRSTPLTLTVTAPSGTGIMLDYSHCPADIPRPVWVAVQDGTGPWTRINGSGDVFAFTVTQPKIGVAIVTSDAGGTTLNVAYFTQTDLLFSVLQKGCAPAGTKTINGTLAGLNAGEVAELWLGHQGTGLLGANGGFQLQNVLDGPFDLVAYKHPIGGVAIADRMALIRDQNITSGGTVGVVDMGPAGSASFSPAVATMTVTGIAGGESVTQSMNYFTGTACTQASLYSGMPVTGSSFIGYGAPALQQRASDLHQIEVVASLGLTQQRTLLEFFHPMGPRTLILGPALPAPVITSLAGPYKRLQAALLAPTEYQSIAELTYDNASISNSVDITASFAWLGGQAVTLAVPDFTGVSGWNNSFGPPSAESGLWSVTATNASFTTLGTACQDGSRTMTASRNGNY